MKNDRVELKEVRGPEGEIQLYDIFIDGKWHGSRRTKEIAELQAEQIINKS